MNCSRTHQITIYYKLWLTLVCLEACSLICLSSVEPHSHVRTTSNKVEEVHKVSAVTGFGSPFTHCFWHRVVASICQCWRRCCRAVHSFSLYSFKRWIFDPFRCVVILWLLCLWFVCGTQFFRSNILLKMLFFSFLFIFQSRSPSCAKWKVASCRKHLVCQLHPA